MDLPYWGILGEWPPASSHLPAQTVRSMTIMCIIYLLFQSNLETLLPTSLSSHVPDPRVLLLRKIRHYVKKDCKGPESMAATRRWQLSRLWSCRDVVYLLQALHSSPGSCKLHIQCPPSRTLLNMSLFLIARGSELGRIYWWKHNLRKYVNKL